MVATQKTVMTEIFATHVSTVLQSKRAFMPVVTQTFAAIRLTTCPRGTRSCLPRACRKKISSRRSRRRCAAFSTLPTSWTSSGRRTTGRFLRTRRYALVSVCISISSVAYPFATSMGDTESGVPGAVQPARRVREGLLRRKVRAAVVRSEVCQQANTHALFRCRFIFYERKQEKRSTRYKGLLLAAAIGVGDYVAAVI